MNPTRSLRPASPLLVLAVLLVAGQARAADVNGRFFEPGSGHKKLLFTNETADEREGSVRRQHSVFKDLQGAVLVVEDASYEKGRFQRLTIEHRQLKARGSVEVKGDRIFFSWTQDGKTRTHDEAARDNLVVGPGVPLWLEQQWPKILKGESVEARMLVPDRLESIDFTFVKARELTVGGVEAVAVTMRPSSIFLAAVVEPATFVIPKSGQGVLEVNGRISPKLKDGDRWKDCSAEGVLSQVEGERAPAAR